MKMLKRSAFYAGILSVMLLLSFVNVMAQSSVESAKVEHDTTLYGDGTRDSPLKIAFPLILDYKTAESGEAKDNTPGIQVVDCNTGLEAHNVCGRVAVAGTTNGYTVGVFGEPSSFAAVKGTCTNYGNGVLGYSENGIGTSGESNYGNGMYATSTYGFGMLAISEHGTALYAASDQGKLAGELFGNVEVKGNLSKGGGSFKIDHPLDPENKYLYHSFVESPDMKNVYDGVVVLDSNGEVIVELPEWFQSLNRDYRYLLTAIGAPGPGLYIAEEVANNHFKIAGGTPGMKVSWQVTGIRQDAYANAHRIKVEEVKPEKERGTYLHPDAFGQPEEKNVEWARHPELLQQMKEMKEKSKKNLR